MFDNPQKDKIFKYLSVGLTVLALALLVMELVGGGPEKESYPSGEAPHPSSKSQEINIDFEVLESTTTKNLKPFPRISYPEKVGRKKPFFPY